MLGIDKMEHPLMERVTKTSAGGTNEDLEFGPVPTGKVWVIRRLALEDETTDCTSARVLLDRGGVEIYLEEETTVTAATLYWMDNPSPVPENTKVIVRFTGSTSGDLLRAYLTGYQIPG